MSVLVQDYKNWCAMVGQFHRCTRARNRYKRQIEGLVPLEEFKAYAKSLVVNLRTNKLPVRAESCFFKVAAQDEITGLTLFIFRDVQRCVNNRVDGTFVESHCAGCPHFGELIEYQRLAANADVARENLNAARQKLFGRFRLSKTK